MLRPSFLKKIRRYFQTHNVVALLGPRQCGKTTLAQEFSATEQDFAPENYFDLEDPDDVRRLSIGMPVLKSLSGLIVIDEIQRAPEIFPLLRVLVDHKNSFQRYLILGSASRELIRQSSESLAGRIAYVEMTPFSFRETNELDALWDRGGFPRSYLAGSELNSRDWREFYIRTFLEQDIPNLGINIPAQTLRRFWTMLGHFHGNILNASELGRSFGASDTTMRRYVDLLTGTFMVRQLQPWHANIKKRQVKSPKIFFRDSGILHSILGLKSRSDLLKSPKLGASWEGFAMEEVIRVLDVNPDQCHFWSTYSGAEIDLVIEKGDRLIGFEFKYGDAPKMTKSIHIALEDLPLDKIYVIYPGQHSYPLSEKVTAKGLIQFLEQSHPLDQ